MQAIEQDTLFDLSEVPVVDPKKDESGQRQKRNKSSAARPRQEQFSLLAGATTETDDSMLIETDEAPSEPVSKFKLNTDDFDTEFAARLHKMIEIRKRIFRDDLGDKAFEVIAYRKGYHWASNGRTDYSVLIRMESGSYTVPDVAVSESTEPDWYIFHDARWDLVDWWMKHFTFRSADHFNRMWQEQIEKCPESMRHWVKSKPVEVISQ